VKPPAKEADKKDIKKSNDPKTDQNIKPAEPKQSSKILLSSSSSSSSKHKKSPAKPAGPAKLLKNYRKSIKEVKLILIQLK
jgi:hypothetical protein